MERILDEAGATRERAAAVISDAMEAESRQVFYAGQKGVVYADPSPDHSIRLKAAELAHRLRGDFPTPKEQERLRFLQIQNNTLIVPPLPRDDRSDAEKKAWRESLCVIEE